MPRNSYEQHITKTCSAEYYGILTSNSLFMFINDFNAYENLDFSLLFIIVLQ